ncbi:MAG: PP-loop superfamily ATP-utilizing enzyme [Desulfovibrionales bacterium]
MGRSLQGKLDALYRELETLQPGLIAVSGGVDSRFLLHAALSRGLRYQAVFFSGPHQGAADKEYAVRWLVSQPVPFHVMYVDLLQVEGVGDNSELRCYFCKQALFRHARTLGRQLGLESILEGSQADDTGEYRPGLRALRELGIKSPLATAGLSKKEIRGAARKLGLERPDQPSRPCLLTRFSYGFAPTPRDLALVTRAEELLFEAGFASFRIRVLPGRVVLQLAEEEKDRFHQKGAAVVQHVKTLGLTIDEILFTQRVSGFFDQA